MHVEIHFRLLAHFDFWAGDCVNIEPDADCEMWTENGECVSNPGWMLYFCAKSCNACSGTTTTSPPNCINTHTSDQECELWAAAGDCESNPEWMIPNCIKACMECPGVSTSLGTTGSSTMPSSACINIHTHHIECDYWASTGQCELNPWMLNNCMRSCGTCGLTPASPSPSSTLPSFTINYGQCNNTYGNDRDCDGWASIGQCLSNPTWMLINCEKSCNSCPSVSATSTPSMTESTSPISTNTSKCVDIHFTSECIGWASVGQCSDNPGWMLVYCQKTCNACPGITSTSSPAPSTTAFSFPHAPCENSHPNDLECEQWSTVGQCSDNPEWMLINCEKACNSCPVVTLTGPPATVSTSAITGSPAPSTTAFSFLHGPCENSHPNDVECEQWATVGQCSDNPEWMLINCEKACNSCRELTSPPGSSTSTLMPSISITTSTLRSPTTPNITKTLTTSTSPTTIQPTIESTSPTTTAATTSSTTTAATTSSTTTGKSLKAMWW